MKTRLAFLLAIIGGLAVTFRASAQEEDAGWLEPYTVSKKVRTVDRDRTGQERKIRTFVETKVYATRQVTEIQEPDTNGTMRVTGRITLITDLLLNSRLTMEERLLPRTGENRVVSVVEDWKAPDGQGYAITRTRNAAGELVETQRSTTVIDAEGTLHTTVETRDKNGNMVVTQTATERRDIGSVP
jgi:hypothetical protein